MNLYSQANWSKDEDEILSSSLVNGIELQVLEIRLPRRSPSAISRRALIAGYGTKSVNGMKILYSGKKTRVHKKNVEEEVTESRKTVVGETRTTPNSSTPTMITSERTNQNFTDVIVADFAHDFNGDALKHLYEDISKLFSSERYPHPKSITVNLKNTVVTISRGTI